MTPAEPSVAFGALLKQLRKRAGMTQRDLAAALNYSDSLISGLENGQRRPDLDIVILHLIPALGLQDEPALATLLLEHAAAARGERLPATQVISSTAHSSPSGSIPALPVELIGRSHEVHHILDRLLGHSGRLLTLMGPPGVGKTTLALAVAHDALARFRDGARFVPLAEVGDAAQMAATLVDALSPGDAGAKQPQTQLVELLRHRSILLVLDNLEQIEGAGPLIAGLLAECPALTILTTSRERLHLRAEQRFKVRPLPLAAAVALFAQRAQAIDAAFRLSDANRAAVAAICTRLDGLPLALELCAAQLEYFSPAQLLDQLRVQPLDLLVGGAQDSPTQHRTLRTAFQCSYASLASHEQALFRRLGVFAGGFDLSAVEAMATWEADDRGAPPSAFSALRSLVGKSLVQAETGHVRDQRFFLLETLREFALEKLRLADEEEPTRRRHYHIYLQRFRAIDAQLRGPEASAWFARLQPEHDNLRAALRWTLDQAHYSDAAWLIVAANWFWEYSNHQYEASQWLVPLMPHYHRLAPDLRLAIWIVLNAYGGYTTETSQLMTRHADEAMALLANSSHQLLQSAAWQLIAARLADPFQAATAREHAIALARTAPDLSVPDGDFCLLADRDFILGLALWKHALRLAEQGEHEQATTLAHESLAILQARGNLYEQAGGFGTLGLVALLQGNLGQAHELLVQAMACATTHNPRWMVCQWQPLLGLIALYRGDLPAAHRLLTESWTCYVELRQKHLVPRISIFLAETALWEAAQDEAENWL